MPYFTCDGQQLHYREQGSGPLLLILPGNTASSACHAGELDYFSQRYHTVALDFLGTGQSVRVARWPDDWWTRSACHAGELIEQLGGEPAIVMGTSGGAIVALWTAILCGEHVRAVVADSTGERLDPDQLRAEMRAREARTPGQMRFWQSAHGNDWDQVVAADTAFLLRFADRGGDCFGGRLNEIGCPVMFSASLYDPSIPNPVDGLSAMSAQVPGSWLFLVNGGDHPLMWSRPEPFRRMCNAFLSSVST